DSAGHTRREVAAGFADYDHPPASHVFASVIADAFDHGAHAAVAHAEALPGHTTDVRLTVGSTMKSHVADDDVFFRHEGRSFGRIQNDFTARETLPKIIVGVALEF